MVAIALFAKSYKEGQSYLTPIVMLVAFPAVVGMLPGLELTPTLALIPIFNVCQLVKEIFLGEFSRLAYGIAFGANLQERKRPLPRLARFCGASFSLLRRHSCRRLEGTFRASLMREARSAKQHRYRRRHECRRCKLKLAPQVARAAIFPQRASRRLDARSA
jgi:hypothetical protein